jgi:hypothetical protein
VAKKFRQDKVKRQREAVRHQLPKEQPRSEKPVEVNVDKLFAPSGREFHSIEELRAFLAR